MANKWIEHIRKWAEQNNTTYSCALSNPKCKEDYKKSLTSKEPIKKEEPITFDNKSAELQQLIYTTPIDKIKKALIELNYKGKMQSNKIMLNMQLLQNFNTIEKIQKLINLLK